MNQEFLANLARERQLRRRREAEAERLANGRGVRCTPFHPEGRAWWWRRAVRFRPVELGLRSALGDERC